MATFPTSIPSYLGFTASHTLLADQHAAQHNQEQADIIAIATKVGTGSSTPTNGKVLVGSATGVSVWRTLVAADLSDIASTIFNATYPVGSIYTETTGVNPATTFGFGTWVAFGGGRVLVGNGTSDQAFAAGATGGESTHQLTTSELAAHTHTITDPGHTHLAMAASTFAGTGAQPITYFSGSSPNYSGNASSTTGITNNNAGSDTAHNNLQPYIVVYFWKRTA